MTLDNMTGITEGSYTGFCKSQLITCNRVKECNGVCPFEDALKHRDKEMNEQTVIDHDRDWIIGCLEHDGFIHTHRFDKANQIILEALSAEAVSRDVYDKRTKADEEIIDSYREKLANCHKEILRLLDFNDITESPNDAIKRQNDVIEVVRCKDCKWYMLADHNETEVCTNKQWDLSMAVYPIISADDYCSYGERREPDECE